MEHFNYGSVDVFDSPFGHLKIDLVDGCFTTVHYYNRNPDNVIYLYGDIFYKYHSLPAYVIKIKGGQMMIGTKEEITMYINSVYVMDEYVGNSI